MIFYTDKQTIDDLNIFGKRGKDSIYSIFNRTVTKGGAEQLEQMFRYPLNDLAAIVERIGKIRFFAENHLEFFGTHTLFEDANVYLALRDTRSKLSHADEGLVNSMRSVFNPDVNLQIIHKGIQAMVDLMQQLKKFLVTAKPLLAPNHPWQKEYQEMTRILAMDEWQMVFKIGPKKLSFDEKSRLDQLFRFKFREELMRLFHYCSLMDVYVSVATVAAARNFVHPEPLPASLNIIDVQELFHPQLSRPVSNSVVLNEEQNLLFLTGANMAGKSTFMKSLAIALYLAHMGFPIPAASMRFSVRDGLMTTINLADNLDMGFSHFYSEVIRVKKVANALQKGLNMFVLIDELFRGTNVMDAHDATVAVAGGFAKKKNCLFVISTHIMEAGEKLKQQFSQISFQFLPTRMEGNKPVYTRKLERGISADRHGMIIIQNEGIIQMLQDAVSKDNLVKGIDNGVYCRQTNAY